MENSTPLNLLSMNNCSPMVVFVLFAVVMAVSIFMTKNTLKKFNSYKMDNLFNFYSIEEFKLLIVMGATVYGLCQYNQINLAWIVMFLPIIYLILRNIFIYIPISNASQNVPKQLAYQPESSFIDQIRKENEQQKDIQQQQMQMANPLRNGGIVNKELGGMGMATGASGMGSGMSPPLNSVEPSGMMDSFSHPLN
tara:strand:- start:155 stop:739 length:585 start_codon:yes stop_codon:yes gene_type:complete